jgi:hypothetical protein
MTSAPIALFVYNRPQHAARVVEALLRNAEAAASPLHVFSDAPKDAAAAAQVEAVRAWARRIRGFRDVILVERARNLGLSGSIVDGVTQLCAAHAQTIVVEDDIEVSPFFLRYMNDALGRYRDEPRVLGVGAYSFPAREPRPETFFFRIPDCWGWATWKRAWDHYEADGAILLAEIRRRGLERELDLDGAHPYVRMLQAQIAGKANSWAVRWYAKALLLGGLTVYPGRSMARNIGMDGSGVHGDATSRYDVELAYRPARVEAVPVREDPAERERIASFLRGARGWRARLSAWFSAPAR